MSAPTSPESVRLEPMPEAFMPDDEEFSVPDPLEEGLLSYLAIIKDGDEEQRFEVCVEKRTNPTTIDGEPIIRESTRFMVSGPEIFTGNGEALHTGDSRYNVMELHETVPPRTQSQKEAIVRSMIAHMMSVE